MQILRLFILSCSHIALSLRQVKSTNRPRPAGFSQKFSARFRKGHPLPCKLARGMRQAFGGSQNLPRQVRHVFGGSQNLPRGVRHVFVGSQKLPRGVRHVFGGSQKLPRQLRHVFGGSQKQRGECGTFSGVPENSADCAARFRGGSQNSAECAAHFRGSRKTARSVRLIFGGPGNQRGVCGSFSGVPEDRPKFHFSAFSIQKLQRKTRFQDSALQYFYGKSSLKAPFPSSAESNGRASDEQLQMTSACG